MRLDALPVESAGELLDDFSETIRASRRSNSFDLLPGSLDRWGREFATR